MKKVFGVVAGLLIVGAAVAPAQQSVHAGSWDWPKGQITAGSWDWPK
jgi:hypothetical protein